MEDLVQSAAELVVAGTATHEEIQKAIKDELMRRSEGERPKLRVYCATYGGFGYSKEFSDFPGTGSSRGDDPVPDLIAFGRRFLEDNPKIARMVATYFAYDLEKLFALRREMHTTLEFYIPNIESA